MYHVKWMSKNIECKIKMYAKIKKHYGRRSTIECSHPKGGPFNLESKFATTLG
jgi:hypothetical protein